MSSIGERSSIAGLMKTLSQGYKYKDMIIVTVCPSCLIIHAHIGYCFFVRIHLHTIEHSVSEQKMQFSSFTYEELGVKR